MFVSVQAIKRVCSTALPDIYILGALEYPKETSAAGLIVRFQCHVTPGDRHVSVAYMMPYYKSQR